MTILNTHRKKRYETQDKLIAAAGKLFLQYGYEDTTLESIADEAGMHVQTLYRHFAGKNDLAFALLAKNLSEFSTYLENRTNSALFAWRDWVELQAKVAAKTHVTDSNEVRLSPRIAEYWHQYESVLAAGIAEDMKVDMSEDARPLLIACMLIGANKHAAQEWRDVGRRKSGPLVDIVVGVVDAVIEEFGSVVQIRT